MRRTVFITGSGSGIGSATVERFAAEGWNVAATMRRPEPDRFSDLRHVEVLPLDVDEPEAIVDARDRAIERFGHVDVVVNNAGYFQMGPLEASSMEQIRAQFETNVFGLIGVCRAFLPHLRTRGSGTIVNISSISAENGYPFVGVYAASKAAVLMLTEALHIELEPVGATAKAILPGAHATAIFTKIDVASGIPLAYRPALERFFARQAAARGSRPEVVADTIWRAVNDGDRDRVRYYAGPDARMIPRAKRLAGNDRYFRNFKRIALNGPGPVVSRLLPQGDASLDVKLDLREAWQAPNSLPPVA